MRSSRELGFTLIELLVSLALLAVTATLLLAAVTTGRAIQQRAEAAAAGGESVAAVQAILRDRIETMIPEAIYGAGLPTVDVRGDDRILTFFASPPEAQRPGPPQRYRVLLTRAGELSLFSLDPLSIRADPNAPSVRGWSRAPLLGNVAGLSIGYFGIAPPDNQRRWRAYWQDRPGLPELVRINVAFQPGDIRVWPELIIRPAATVNTACRVDRLTGRCRVGPT